MELAAAPTGIEYIFHSLNSSKYFSGITMILLNLGSRYLGSELSLTHEGILSSVLFRRILIFVVFFTATRDVVVSLIMTICFIIIISIFSHDQSKYCLIPKKYRIYEEDRQIEITQKDIENAKKILKLAEERKKNLKPKNKKLLESFNRKERYKRNMLKLNVNNYLPFLK